MEKSNGGTCGYPLPTVVELVRQLRQWVWPQHLSFMAKKYWLIVTLKEMRRVVLACKKGRARTRCIWCFSQPSTNGWCHCTDNARKFDDCSFYDSVSWCRNRVNEPTNVEQRWRKLQKKIKDDYDYIHRLPTFTRAFDDECLYGQRHSSNPWCNVNTTRLGCHNSWTRSRWFANTNPQLKIEGVL